MCLVFFMLLFFFFKQKTAYEMRISDWSSDVCSSDLLAFQLFAYWLPPEILNGISGIEDALGLPSEAEQLACYEAASGRDIGVDWPLYRIYKIGRASCRERVCPYV